MPSRFSCTKVSAFGANFCAALRISSAPWPITSARPVAPAASAAFTTCATIGRPAMACSTLGMALFMRVPSPAARMTDRQDLWLMGRQPYEKGLNQCKLAAQAILHQCG
ncbi:hypothetical protein MPL1032_270027 [Mesorhizobium plurifarium]|uniref:Uncharacterized protein n=1 Tax=Mesorhizobium plurifarium TaxID=69974 RepID=A0A0K2W1W3_MESPL|nr:hypothetical protein MPL1032_270027 [Mesorhizobium plurifarium]